MSVTGENEQGLRTIIDFVRKASFIVLAIHFSIVCYAAVEQWTKVPAIVQRILINIGSNAVFRNPSYAKFTAVGLLILSLVGSKGKKDEKAKPVTIVAFIIGGLITYFGSVIVFYVFNSFSTIAASYIVLTICGYLLILTGGARLSRLITVKLAKDIFNEDNETFPQEERLLTNEYSVNLPGQYMLKGKTRSMWINIINPMRGNLCIGSPGAGKSFFFIRHVITQHIHKGYTMFLYDFKYPDLTKIAYNTLKHNHRAYRKTPTFYYINFDDLNQTHRCNPLDPESMVDITDAAEASRSILLGLNRDWIKKTGDFFVESPINFVTAIIWFLRKYKDGKFCTLPHVIELMQMDYNDLFPVLGAEAEIEVLINPFITAYMNRAMEQLEGQIASAKIGMARLSSPTLYYVLSGNDFKLDVNNPDDPKIVAVGNNPLKTQIYGAVLSLYITRVIKLVNRKDQLKCSLIFDEFPTIYFQGMDSLIATARSNKVSTTIAIQDYSQLKKDYSREQAEVIMNICANIVSGQAVGDTAKMLSERFGKIVQQRESISINRTDTSISRNTQLDFAIPASRIASLSSGEFVGMVADNPDQPIKLKTFHCKIINDIEKIKSEESNYKSLPEVRTVTPLEVANNFIRIKNDSVEIIETEIERIKNDPGLSHLLFVRPEKPKQ
jgi:hypothetical protein